jgi:hypothetical protein
VAERPAEQRTFVRESAASARARTLNRSTRACSRSWSSLKLGSRFALAEEGAMVGGRCSWSSNPVRRPSSTFRRLPNTRAFGRGSINGCLLMIVG